MKLKLAAVTVFYNPDDSVKENIDTYINHVDRLYIVDNSERKNFSLINTLQTDERIHYINNNENQGIAHALNTGAACAISDSFTFLLTMDQDSRFPDDSIAILKNSIDMNDTNTGIIAPLFYEDEHERFPFSHLVSITSGCIMNLNVYQKIGPFKDDFFIDSVDIEYCLRMHREGFSLKRIPSVIIDHQLGDIKKQRFLFWEFSSTNHSALRRYYMIRNRFYIWKKFKKIYPDYIRYEQIETIKEMIKILLGENDKMKKIWMSILGYIDYKRNKFGKYVGLYEDN
jgi:rhamnosyltransferase